jgi:hypothetical protein
MNDSTSQGRFLPYLSLGLLLLFGSVNCSDQKTSINPVAGVITPEYFRFRETVPDDKRAVGGGWRAVCIQAVIIHGDSEAKTLCKFEVGTPLRTREQGEIPLEAAQFAAASMANRAARDVLSTAHPGDMFAVLCNRFKRTYEFMLREKYDGARVKECDTAGIETVTFGVPPAQVPVP